MYARWSTPLVLITVAALALTGCTGAAPPNPDAPRPPSVCIPTGDGSYLQIGPIYRCAAQGVSEGRTNSVAYATGFSVSGKEPITGWMDMRFAGRLLSNELAAGYGLPTGVKTPGNLPAVAACLWEGGSLTCVSPQFPKGFTYRLATGTDVALADAGFELVKPLGEGTTVKGLPETLPRQQAAEFLADYAVWTYNPLVTQPPWPRTPASSSAPPPGGMGKLAYREVYDDAVPANAQKKVLEDVVFTVGLHVGGSEDLWKVADREDFSTANLVMNDTRSWTGVQYEGAYYLFNVPAYPIDPAEPYSTGEVVVTQVPFQRYPCLGDIINVYWYQAELGDWTNEDVDMVAYGWELVDSIYGLDGRYCWARPTGVPLPDPAPVTVKSERGAKQALLQANLSYTALSYLYTSWEELDETWPYDPEYKPTVTTLAVGKDAAGNKAYLFLTDRLTGPWHDRFIVLPTGAVIPDLAQDEFWACQDMFDVDLHTYGTESGSQTTGPPAPAVITDQGAAELALLRYLPTEFTMPSFGSLEELNAYGGGVSLVAEGTLDGQTVWCFDFAIERTGVGRAIVLPSGEVVAIFDDNWEQYQPWFTVSIEP